MSGRARAISFGVLMVVVAGAAFLLGRDSRNSPAAAPPEASEEAQAAAAVKIAPIRSGAITETVEAFGIMQPAAGSTVVVSVPFESRVVRVFVTAGAKVEPGSPIVEIGPSADAELQLRQAQDALAAAGRTLQQAQLRLREQLATNADLATAEQAERTARTQLESLTQRGVASTKKIAAEVAGVVTAVSAQPGQVLAAGTTMATIAPAQAIDAVIGVEPSIASALKPGDSIELHTLDGNGAPSVGTVRAVGQQINPQTHLRDVSITPAADARLLSGAFVVAEVPTRTGEGLIMPRSAIALTEDDPVVFTVSEEKAKKHVVRLGLKNANDVQVSADDLRAGDVVVVEGALELEDGMRVKSETASEPAKSPEDAKHATTSPAVEAK